MKTNFLHIIFAPLMSLLVLFSTLSFTVESHYCGDFLIDTAIFTEAQGCGMNAKEEAKIKKNCCKDEVVIIQGQDELKFSAFDDLDFNAQFVLTAYAYSYNALFKALPKQIIPHKDYTPPKLIYDIQVINDTFLI
ncbi:hypothetical protein [Lacinutrix sp. 5H-3-7-4]|uniref:HYC_CC_PP family protein n=1 Tax=Lacinutrix sp. (strain 5H-3-7-4) TaxID=983544 RepID=UPI00352948DE